MGTLQKNMLQAYILRRCQQKGSTTSTHKIMLLLASWMMNQNNTSIALMFTLHQIILYSNNYWDPLVLSKDMELLCR